MSSTIRNGLARTIQHGGNLLAQANENRERAREREITRTREELRGEVIRRVRAETDAEDMRKHCVELEERVAEGDALLLYWANSSKAYLETLDFLQKNWSPRGNAAQDKAAIVDAKIAEAFKKAESAPKEEQEAYRRQNDAKRLSNIRQARNKRRSP